MHKQREAEETGEFDRIMQEVSALKTGAGGAGAAAAGSGAGGAGSAKQRQQQTRVRPRTLVLDAKKCTKSLLDCP